MDYVTYRLGRLAELEETVKHYEALARRYGRQRNKKLAKACRAYAQYGRAKVAREYQKLEFLANWLAL